MNDFCSRSYCHRYLDMFQHFHHMLVLSVRRMRLAGGVFPSLCSFISALVGGNKVPLEARLKRFRRACKLAIKTGCDKLAIKMDIQRIYAGASFVNAYLLPHIAAVFVSSRWLPKAVSLFASHKRLRTLDTWISERSWNKSGMYHHIYCRTLRWCIVHAFILFATYFGETENNLTVFRRYLAWIKPVVTICTSKISMLCSEFIPFA